MISSGISVIVCCYNSAARLPETLKHLAMQLVPGNISWEVIIVDNASTDSTSEIAENEWQKYDQPSEKLRIVNEKEPGLSYARQKGAQEASYKYLIFCDDDNWLNSSYISNAFIIMENDPKIGALGGKSTATTDDNQFPEWFESKQNGFAVGSQSPVQGDVSQTCGLWGAGMVTRTELYLKSFNKMYPSILVGRKGEILSSGEDTEFCYRLLLMGYRLFYDETLTFVHFISKERWSPDYIERSIKSCETGVFDSMELNKYSLLNKLVYTKKTLKPILIVKTFLGYLSTLAGRTSWSFAESKIIFYYYSQIDLGVDKNTKDIFSFYKENRQ